MRRVVKTYLTMQRFEVFLAVLLPSFLIFESAMANGTVYAGGVMDLHDPRSWVAFGRGLFFEVLTYACSKLAKLLAIKRRGWGRVSLLIPGTVALWCIIVSAGNNLGWVLNGGDFVGVFASMARFMPHSFLMLYEAGLGLLLPLSVGALALVDMSHLVQEAIEHSHFDNEALRVAESEMHRTAYLKSQNKQRGKIQKAYDGLADQRATAYIQKVQNGDMSFGANDQKALPAGSPGIRRINGPAVQSQPILQAQVSQPGLPTGGTQQITIPPAGSPVGSPAGAIPQQQGAFKRFLNSVSGS